MALTERLALLVTANTDGAVRGLVKVGNTADKELGKAETRIEKLGAGFTKFGSASLLAGGLAAAGLFKAGQAASNLQQAVGGTDAIFGSASKAIDKYAKDSAQSLGLSERSFRELTTVAGASLKGLGFSVGEAADQSIKLTQIGADLAATFGGTTEEAVAALGATLRGEFDPAEKFGVALTAQAVAAKAVELGLAKTTSSVDSHAKAQATLALIMERTADAQGQFAREADTAAGSQQRMRAELENLQASIGQAVLPVLSKLAGGVGDAVGAFNKLPEGAKSATSEVLAFGTAGLLVAGGISSIIGRLIKMRDTFTDIGEDGSRSMNKLGKAVSAVGAVLVAVEIANVLNDIAQAGKNVHVSADELTSDLGKMDQFARDTAEGGGILGASLEDLTRQLATQSIPSAQLYIDALGRQGVATGDLQKIIDDKTKAEGIASVATDKHAAAVDEAKKALTGEAGAAEDATRSLAELVAVTKTLFASNVNAEQAQVAFAKAVDDYTSSIEDAASATDDASTAVNEHEAAALDMTSALLGADEAARRLADAQVKAAEDTATAAGATLDAESANRIYRDSLQHTADSLAPGSPLRARLLGYITELDRTQGERQAVITANVDQALAQLGRVRTLLYSMFSATSRAGLGSLTAADTVPLLAEGGIVKHKPGGTLVRVAEAGFDEAWVPLDKPGILEGIRAVVAQGGLAGRPGAREVTASETAPPRIAELAEGGIVRARDGSVVPLVAPEAAPKMRSTSPSPGSVGSAPAPARSAPGVEVPAPARAGRVVGANGPALFTPPVSGFIIPNLTARSPRDTSRATGAPERLPGPLGEAPRPRMLTRVQEVIKSASEVIRSWSKHDTRTDRSTDRSTDRRTDRSTHNVTTRKVLSDLYGLASSIAPGRRQVTVNEIAGTRVAGGPVKKGLTYLVGEKRPERYEPAMATWREPQPAVTRNPALSTAQAPARAPAFPANLAPFIPPSVMFPGTTSTPGVNNTTTNKGALTLVYNAAPKDPVSVADAAKELRAMAFRFGHD